MSEQRRWTITGHLIPNSRLRAVHEWWEVRGSSPLEDGEVVDVAPANETSESRAEFWEDRYNVQHRTLHGMEDEIARLRADLEAAERRVEKYREALEEVEACNTETKCEKCIAVAAAALSTTEEPKEEPCFDCDGTGGGEEFVAPCPTCKGTGKRAEEPARGT